MTDLDRSGGSRAESFRNAFAGLAYTLRTQRNAWIHLAATLLVVSLGAVLGVERVEWGLLLGAMGLVWVSELVNTALETAVDLASPGWHPLAARAKDISAAAVLLSAFTAAMIGGIVFLPRLLSRILG